MVISNICPCGKTTVVTNLRISTTLVVQSSAFLQEEGQLAIFFNFFAPGHGKRICNSEGGVPKHAVALAALQHIKLISPYNLYKYLEENCTDMFSKTSSALHSPDWHD